MFGRLCAWIAAFYQLANLTLGDGVSSDKLVVLAEPRAIGVSIYSVASDEAFSDSIEDTVAPAVQPAQDGGPPADRFLLAARLQSVATLNRPTARAWLTHSKHPAYAARQTVKRVPNRVVWREHRMSRLIPSQISASERRTPVLTLVNTNVAASTAGQQQAA